MDAIEKIGGEARRTVQRTHTALHQEDLLGTPPLSSEKSFTSFPARPTLRCWEEGLADKGYSRGAWPAQGLGLWARLSGLSFGKMTPGRTGPLTPASVPALARSEALLPKSSLVTCAWQPAISTDILLSFLSLDNKQSSRAGLGSNILYH
jgi:hypothetical protein